MISGGYRCPLYDDDAAVTTTDLGSDQATHQLDSADSLDVKVFGVLKDRGVVITRCQVHHHMLATANQLPAYPDVLKCNPTSPLCTIVK